MRRLSDIVAHIFHPRRSNNQRARLLHPEALFFMILIASGFVALLHLFSGLTSSSKNILGYASTIIPKEVVEKTNQERIRLGLEPLALDTTLSEAALAKGQNMFADQYWSHTSPDGVEPWHFMHQVGYEYQVAGENLARDFSDTPSMIAAWMASPNHRANIVNSKYSDIGIAVIDGRLEGYETTLVVQMFGAQAVKGVGTEIAAGESSLVTVQTSGEAVKRSQSEVLASVLVPGGSVDAPPLFTPLQLTKAFFLAVIMLIIATLAYDTFVIGHRGTIRIVGNNLGHIFLLVAVMYLVIFFKGGIVG